MCINLNLFLAYKILSHSNSGWWYFHLPSHPSEKPESFLASCSQTLLEFIILSPLPPFLPSSSLHWTISIASWLPQICLPKCCHRNKSKIQVQLYLSPAGNLQVTQRHGKQDIVYLHPYPYLQLHLTLVFCVRVIPFPKNFMLFVISVTLIFL